MRNLNSDLWSGRMDERQRETEIIQGVMRFKNKKNKNRSFDRAHNYDCDKYILCNKQDHDE
jgi:hypothetical protein